MVGRCSSRRQTADAQPVLHCPLPCPSAQPQPILHRTTTHLSGHYVPQHSQAILRHDSATSKNTVNLKGYMVGNALTDDYHDHLGVFQFMWSAGLIFDETYKLLNLFCSFDSFIHSSKPCGNVQDIANKELGDIDPYSIYTPACTVKSSVSKRLLKRLVEDTDQDQNLTLIAAPDREQEQVLQKCQMVDFKNCLKDQGTKVI